MSPYGSLQPRRPLPRTPAGSMAAAPRHKPRPRVRPLVKPRSAHALERSHWPAPTVQTKGSAAAGVDWAKRGPQRGRGVEATAGRGAVVRGGGAVGAGRPGGRRGAGSPLAPPPCTPPAPGLLPGPRPPLLPRGLLSPQRGRQPGRAGAWTQKAEPNRQLDPQLHTPCAAPGPGVHPRPAGTLSADRGREVRRPPRRAGLRLLALPGELARRVRRRGGRDGPWGDQPGGEWLRGAPSQRKAREAALGAPPGMNIFWSLDREESDSPDRLKQWFPGWREKNLGPGRDLFGAKRAAL
ncbi:uncharacterized protein LOC101725863 [Heterocephalus glaber]|uniref:Uncharacterized protein LOC101725863 n=1 Tax=Heterocephalus glaber TaxID=10181 RepID=A0AAX6R2F8_HETGA|nr:uncharacterized protein LOC101725863 [Heterocephalus glaber]